MRPCGPRAGFTLIELTIVLFIAAVVLAVAAPRLAPMVALSEHEGAARHLAGYGRAAMVHCAFMRQRITVKFDLEKQEVYAVEWESEEAGFLRDEADEASEEEDGAARTAMLNPQELLALEDEQQIADQAEALDASFERFVRLNMYTRTRNVKREGVLSDIGPLFEEDFTLRDDEGDDEREIQDDLLRRTPLPKGVRIDSIVVGNDERFNGTVEVDVAPTGLLQPVRIYVANDRGDYYTVVWDAITGGTHLYDGKKTESS